MRTIKQYIPTSWKTTARKIFGDVIDQVQGYGSINRGGRGVINLIDIGAVGKLPSPWYEHAPLIHNLLSFEPRENARQRPHVIALDAAVWSHDEAREFFIYAGNQGHRSSLLEQNVEYVRAHYDELKERGPRHLAETWFERSTLVKTVPVECRCLDNILGELSADIRYHFLKVDVQGAEYQVLQGAENYLKTACLGLHMELFTIPLYKDMVLLPDVVAYLKTAGFELVKKMPPHGTFDSQHDCLFLKQNVCPEDAAIIAAIRRVYAASLT